MKKLVVLSVAALLSLSFTVMAQMTDSQVISYVKSANEAGKSETQIGRELLSKGVTKEQLQKIKSQFEEGTINTNGASKTSSENSVVNPRQVKKSGDNKTQNDADTRSRDYVDHGNRNFDIRDAENGMDMFYMPEDSLKIFGHDIFRNNTLSFEPNENTATPEDYKLGPGDEVIIEIWGYNEASITQVISPEGKINISQIGPVQLGGLTIKEASAKIKKALRSKYAGIGGDRPNSEVSITLGQIRSIQVNVMGEARVPGTYRLSSFSSVFTALYRAGGVTMTGSLRNIKVVRGGEECAIVDVYGYLFNGKSESDIRLQEGDIIIVPPYSNLVLIQGGVKRPMYYELVEGETVADAIAYAGGFTSDAHKDDVLVERKSGKQREVITVTEAKMNGTRVEDGDVITVASTFEKYANRLEIKGYVFRPGLYELGNDIKTVKDLVNAAGGLREDAFLARAIITRELDDLSLETISVPVGAIMKGTIADVALRKNDILTISGTYELNDRGTMTINGMVANPGSFPFAENTSVEDLIIQAGGLVDGASMARVEVARRVADMSGLFPTDIIGETYSFAIKDGLSIDGADEFILQPYDVVSVRKSPAFQTQQFVTLQGEVTFPGEYVLQNRNETLSDLINRAGGVTDRAFLNGGLLIRRTNDEENTLHNATKRMIEMNSDTDSLDVDKMNFKDTYTVGIQMDKALANPGSAYDIKLREGDRIVVPEYVSTVSIQGTVMYPNVVQYVQGKGVEYYIKAAGGYGNRAKRSKAYIVYMNGNVSKASSGKVEPGCEIVVPSKGEKARMTTGEYISLGTSAASLATMVATLVNLFK